MTNIDYYRQRLTNLCRKQPQPTPRVLSGIEREALEQSEVDNFWRELRKADGR